MKVKLYFTMNKDTNHIHQVFINEQDFIEKNDTWKIPELLNLKVKLFSILSKPIQEDQYALIDLPF